MDTTGACFAIASPFGYVVCFVFHPFELLRLLHTNTPHQHQTGPRRLETLIAVCQHYTALHFLPLLFKSSECVGFSPLQRLGYHFRPFRGCFRCRLFLFWPRQIPFRLLFGMSARIATFSEMKWEMRCCYYFNGRSVYPYTHIRTHLPPGHLFPTCLHPCVKYALATRTARCFRLFFLHVHSLLPRPSAAHAGPVFMNESKQPFRLAW